jgi:hypothetical protein
MEVRTSDKMPPLGAFHAIMPEVDGGTAMWVWLNMHRLWNGPDLVKTIVLRECLPSPEAVLDFEAVSCILTNSE